MSGFRTVRIPHEYRLTVYPVNDDERASSLPDEFRTSAAFLIGSLLKGHDYSSVELDSASKSFLSLYRGPHPFDGGHLVIFRIGYEIVATASLEL